MLRVYFLEFTQIFPEPFEDDSVNDAVIDPDENDAQNHRHGKSYVESDQRWMIQLYALLR